VVGNRVRVKVVKNKMAPPFKQAEFDVLFAEGISKAGELVDLGVEKRVLEKSGAWYSYKGERLGQGREAVRDHLKTNQAVAKEIEARLRDIAGIGVHRPTEKRQEGRIEEKRPEVRADEKRAHAGR
jgi:recombination protein RecA